MEHHLLDRINSLLQSLLQQENIFLVEVLIRGKRQSKVVEIYIDTDSGITSGQVSQVSRGIADIFEKENLIEGRYRLDVSSPDLSRPIKLFRQYNKNIGRKFKIEYTSNNENKTVEATLNSIEGEILHFQTTEKVECVISVSSISAAYVIPKCK